MGSEDAGVHGKLLLEPETVCPVGSGNTHTLMFSVCVCVFSGCVLKCVCLQEDLSEPLLEEDLDGGSGVIFPFYDADTHMLYLAGKVHFELFKKKKLFCELALNHLSELHQIWHKSSLDNEDKKLSKAS